MQALQLETELEDKSVRRFQNQTLKQNRYEKIDFRNCEFINFDGSKKEFVDCDFRFTFIERSYFRDSVFKNCNFTGSRFQDSNFRGCKFTENCSFDYAQFSRTVLPSKEMARNMPGWSNVQVSLCMNLRANFTELGDHEAAKKFFQLQMEATTEDLRGASRGTGAYYTKERFHSKWPARLDFRFPYYLHTISSFTWGHGLKPVRFLGLVAGVLVIAIALFSITPEQIKATPYDGSVQQLIDTLFEVAFYVVSTFLGISYSMEPLTKWTRFLTAFVGGIGYLCLGLIVAATYRSLARP